jgi:hypothetical protein
MKKKNKKIKDNKIKDLLSNQKGIALLTVLIFIFLMVTFVVALLAMTGNDIKISAIQRDSTKAFYQAESGIEQALYNLNVDSINYDIIHWRPGPVGQNPPEPYKKSPSNSSEYYEVTITNIGNTGADPPELSTDKIRIISTGILTPVGVEHSRKRSIEVIAEIGWNTDVTYKYAVLSDKVILVNGSGPDMPTIVGDIHSNDAIDVNGHFADGYDGTATASGETNDLDETEDGEFTGVEPIDIPPVDYAMLEANASNSWGDVTLDNNSDPWVQEGIQFIDGDLRVKNGGKVIVTNGAIVVTGNVIFDNGSELTITKSTNPITPLGLVAKGDIILKAKTTFISGVVQSYCPLDPPPEDAYTSGTVELHNDAVIWGSVIAGTIFLHNGTEINYEEGDTQKYVTTGDPFYKKISWREL